MAAEMRKFSLEHGFNAVVGSAPPPANRRRQRRSNLIDGEFYFKPGRPGRAFCCRQAAFSQRFWREQKGVAGSCWHRRRMIFACVSNFPHTSVPPL
jgi:hypothetical protein